MSDGVISVHTESNQDISGPVSDHELTKPGRKMGNKIKIRTFPTVYTGHKSTRDDKSLSFKDLPSFNGNKKDPYVLESQKGKK